MAYARVVISSGHGKYVRGAAGIIDEVDEARRVVEALASELRARDVGVVEFHDNVSHSQSDNLDAIVDAHNAEERDLDVSIHFNAYEQVEKPMGVEVLYVTQPELASKVSQAIADCGFINRGAKKRTDLAFLNGTEMPAILIEVCFVDSEADCDVYARQFADICEAIADVLGGEDESTGADDGGAVPGRPPRPPRPPVQPPSEVLRVQGPCSQFGGPKDEGVSASEGLAFISDIEQAPHLFLPEQPSGTTGLARRLNPYVHYIACRWDYDDIPKADMLEHVALVRAIKTGVELTAIPADWGPHEDTGRVADLSPSLLADLGIETDDEVEVVFPYTP
jgi:N-acetylmuramoyl-L-alanine amidase